MFLLKLQLFHNDKYKKQVSVTSETIRKSTKKKTARITRE